ncbi:hypothetical protein C8J57DRAFT_1613030 [Mycena rebaudengoi]|nr:hypothetical protein C8J57DRAFT_1613030 [Mycena rebaudengoi]
MFLTENKRLVSDVNKNLTGEKRAKITELCGHLLMLHNIRRLNFLREMDSQQKDPISAQCGTCSGALPRTKIEEEVVTPQPISICNGSMIIFAEEEEEEDVLLRRSLKGTSILYPHTQYPKLNSQTWLKGAELTRNPESNGEVARRLIKESPDLVHVLGKQPHRFAQAYKF